MTTDGKTVTWVQSSNTVDIIDKEWPIEHKRALYHKELSRCRGDLELRDELIRESGNLGEGKFLKRPVVWGVEGEVENVKRCFSWLVW